MQQHQGSKNCRANIVKREKVKKQQKLCTLFDVGGQKTGGSINNSGASQPPLLKVGPSLESPAPIQDLSNDLKGVVKRKGYGEAWNLLEKLSDRVEELEINQDIPVANGGDELEGYNKETAKVMCDGVNAEEV